MVSNSDQLSIHPLRSIDVDGVEYHFIEEGKGKTIVFLHGFPDYAGTWDNAITFFAKDYKCIAPFLLGYYPTDLPEDGNYSVVRIAKDIANLLEKLCISEFIVVGHDWGATVGYIMANLFPNKVSKLCTLAMPHPKFLKPTFKLLLKARHILYLLSKSKAEERLKRENFSYIDILYNRWSPNWEGAYTHACKVKRCMSHPYRARAAVSYYWELTKRRAKANQPLIEKISAIPILTMVGEQDGTIVLKQFFQMQEEMNVTLQLKVHPSAGHFLHLEEPQYFINQLQLFLKQ